MRHGLGGYTNHACRCDVCKSAKRDHNRTYRKDQDTSVVVHVRLTPDLAAALKLVADGEDSTVSGVIRQAICDRIGWKS